jgi:pentatricopeptide repeat protein
MTDHLLRVLGSAELVASGTTQKLPEKGFQLLSYLLLAPTQRGTRRQLADLLWDSIDDSSALSNLRQLLLRLRRFAVMQEILASDGTAVWLLPGVHSDLSRFLRRAPAGDLPEMLEALSLYRGDLLGQTHDASTACWQWLGAARMRLREMFFGAASRALMELTRFGNAPVEALRGIERQVLAVEPDREASYRTLIEAYGRNGMRDDAARLYAALEAVLAQEFQADMSSETRAVFRRANSGAEIVGPPAQDDRHELDLARVAFLPLRLLSRAGDGELIRALFDDVANNLARYRTMTVLAIHSSFQRHATSDEVRDPALDADYHVSGFVLPDGVSLSLRMVETATRRIIWAAEYSLTPERLNSTFRMLSQQVAASLADAIEHRRIVAATPVAVAAAYHSYLRGKAQLATIELPRLRRARLAFQSAAEAQVRYAAAHARLAQTLYLEWLLLGGTDPQMLVAARQEADRAIAYDGGGAEGHSMRGVISLYQRDYDGAGEHFATAETLGPHSADLLVQYADALSHLGQPRQGWQRFERALELNPLPPDHYWWAGASIAFVEERYELALQLCANMTSDTPAIRLLAATHGLLGNTEAARAFGRRVRDAYPGVSRQDIARLVPARDRTTLTRFLDGLRLAGVE